METIEINSSDELHIGDVITKWNKLYVITGYIKYDDGTKLLDAHLLYGSETRVTCFRDTDFRSTCGFLKVLI